ncbi:MAG: hypothetical protein ABIR19_01685, partial [Ginsengibacter sp.]
MKKIMISFLIFALTIASCNTSNSALDMPGTYLMLSQTLNNNGKDTRFNSLKQLKMYTDGFFMYTQLNPSDSVSAFGVGSYTTIKDTVVESVIYNASGTAIGTPNTYHLAIDKVHEGFTQVIPEIVVQNQKNKLTEEYQEVGEKLPTPLEGIWKELKSYSIVGVDTTINNRTQYKAFYDGYFMFGHTVRDSSSKITTGIGFGTFKMNGENQITETDLNSTYAIIAGNSFIVDFEMDGS